MPYHPLHPSGPHSHLRKRHYMEVDLASGLRRCQSNHQIFRRAAPGLAERSRLVKFCIIFPGVLGGGLTVLLYLSAIQGVSSDIMESAALDGCTGFSKIFRIILPNISFMIFIQLIMCVITTMQLLDAPYMYASGGPSGASTHRDFDL